MIVEPTRLAGAFHIEVERVEDARGYFARLWCRRELAEYGIPADFVQSSISHNLLAGTMRGMHFQWPPSNECKLVRCERGSAFDAIIDLRPESPTFGQHASFVLESERRNALFIPSGFAHGFQTLVADCDITYLMTDFQDPALADGVRFDDSAFGINWPLPVARIHERDRTYADFNADRHALAYAARLAGSPNGIVKRN